MVNQDLHVDVPLGDNWRFSLDPTADVASFQADRTFQADAQGRPFVHGQTYTVLAYDTDSTALLSHVVVFQAGPSSTALTEPALIPDLRMTTHRGAETDVFITVGGVQVLTLAEVLTATHVLVPQLINGVQRFVRFPIAKLLTIKPPTITRRILGKYKLVSATGQAAPNAPTDLKVTYGDGGGGNARLNWQDNSDVEAGFEVERSNSAAGPFTKVGDVAANVTLQYLLINQLGQSFFYRVRAQNAAGESGYSNTVEVRIEPPVQVQLRAIFSRHSTGSPPPKLGSNLADGDSVVRLPTGQNFGVVIQTLAGAEPAADAYEGISFEVLEVATGQQLGWTYNETGIKPGPDTAFCFIRPNGLPLMAGAYELKVSIWKNGGVLRTFPTVHITLTEPNYAPVAPAIYPISMVSGTEKTVVLPPFTDPENGPLTYTVSYAAGEPAMAGNTFVTGTRSLTLPASVPVGTYHLTYGAIDDHGNQTTTPLIVQATATPPPPAPPPTITQVRGSQTVESPSFMAIYFEVSLANPTGDLQELEWEVLSGEFAPGWFDAAAFQSNLTALQLRWLYSRPAGNVDNQTFRFRVRPKTNPTAIAGPFSMAYGSENTHGFIVLNPTN